MPRITRQPELLDPGGIRLAVYTAGALALAGLVLLAALWLVLRSRYLGELQALRERALTAERRAAGLPPVQPAAPRPPSPDAVGDPELARARTRAAKAEAKALLLEERLRDASAERDRATARATGLEERALRAELRADQLAKAEPAPDARAEATIADLRERLAAAEKAVAAERERAKALARARDAADARALEALAAVDPRRIDGAKTEPRTGGADGDAEVAAALAAAGEETVTYLTDEVLLAILEERFTDAFLDTIERRRGGLFHCRMQGVALVIANSGRRLTFFTAVQAKAATPERVSRFNASHNFVRAYLDPEGDACLQLDVLVRTGITRASLGELAQLFALAVPRFVQEVGGETPPTADAGEATPLRAAPDEADPDADRPSDFGGIEIDLTPRTDGAR